MKIDKNKDSYQMTNQELKQLEYEEEQEFRKELKEALKIQIEKEAQRNYSEAYKQKLDKLNEEDKNIYREFLEGDMNALKRLIAKYRYRLVSFLIKYLNDYQVAEDISQEVFVYLLQHKTDYDFTYSLRTYLYTIAKSRGKNYIKSRKKFIFAQDKDNFTFDDIVNIEEDAFVSIETYRIKKALKELKWEYKMAVYLCDVDNLTYEEAAIVMEKSVEQIKAAVHNARNSIKNLLEGKVKEGVKHDEINGGIHK